VTTELALVILAVEQLPRATAFYRTVLEWKQVVDAPAYCELESPRGMRLGIYDRRSFGNNVGGIPAPHPGPIATTELYFHVEDVDAMVARACEAGARLLGAAADRAWGDRVAYVADLDGFVVAFARRA
jgi:predicted enzyme related to lactoylglutathione lyase